MTPEEVKSFLKNSHELGIQRNRIIKRLERASLSGLKRFADAIEVLSDEELDGIALECERMALEKIKAIQESAHDLEGLKCSCGKDSSHESGWCGECVFERQPDESEELEENGQI